MNEPRPVPPQGSAAGQPQHAVQPHRPQPHVAQPHAAHPHAAHAHAAHPHGPQPAQGHAHGAAHAPAHTTPVPRPAAGAPRAPSAPPPAQRRPGQPAQLGGSPAQALRPVPPPLPVGRAAPGTDGDEELIALDDEDDAAAPVPARAAAPTAAAPAAAPAPVAPIAPPSKIKITGAGDKHNYTNFKRPAHVSGTGACRMRTFHGRLSDEGLAFMDDKINEWLDNHPEVEVKHVNTLIGAMGGKSGEAEMFVTIWY